MKKLVYPATIALVIAATLPAVATGVPGATNSTHLIHSGAHPNNARIKSATHHFELHTEGKALSQLSIDLPERIDVNRGIEITDSTGKKVEGRVSINDRKATIAFPQPVPPGTILSVSLKGVQTPGYLRRTWVYRVYSQMEGIQPENIPIGTARIQTY